METTAQNNPMKVTRIKKFEFKMGDCLYRLAGKLVGVAIAAVCGAVMFTEADIFAKVVVAVLCVLLFIQRWFYRDLIANYRKERALAKKAAFAVRSNRIQRY